MVQQSPQQPHPRQQYAAPSHHSPLQAHLMSGGSQGSQLNSQPSSHVNVYGGSHPAAANGQMPSAYYMTPGAPAPAPAAPPRGGGSPVKGFEAHKTWTDEEGAEGSSHSFCTRFKFVIWLATVLLLVRYAWSHRSSAPIHSCHMAPCLLLTHCFQRLHPSRPPLQICAAVGLSVTMAVVMKNRDSGNPSPTPSPDPAEPDSGGGGDGSGGDGNTGARITACALCHAVLWCGWREAVRGGLQGARCCAAACALLRQLRPGCGPCFQPLLLPTCRPATGPLPVPSENPDWVPAGQQAIW